MSKRKASTSQEDESPPAKASNTDESVDYFKEHFCQDLDEHFAKRLKDGTSDAPQKIRFNNIDRNHSAQYFDKGFDLVSNFNTLTHHFDYF